MSALCICLAVFAFSDETKAQGQEGADTAYGSELSGYVGHLLPNQIAGITEILPVFGFRYGYPTLAGVVEIGGANSHAEGVDVTTASLSLRSEFPLIEHFSGIFYIGGDSHYYRPIGQTERLSAAGGHFGGGLMMHVANTMWFRTEMKFNMIPGTSLSILFGLVLRGPESGGAN